MPNYSIKDVARLAGVSISTVSNVLNKTRSVSQKTIEKVEKIAKELNYQVDPIARSLKDSKTGQIGIIVEDICGVFYPYIIKGINSVATKKGYSLLISDAQGMNGNEIAVDNEKEIFNKFFNTRVDGVIFVTAAKIETLGDYFSTIKEHGNRKKYTPLVSIERDLTSIGIDSVYYDSLGNAKIAVQHLIDCGCRHVVHISGPTSMHVAQQRVVGYLTCMDENHMGVNMQTMISYGDYSHQSGYKAMIELLEKFPQLDGVFCGNDQMAIGALKALKQKGKHVPEDVKIIGYDDSFVSTITEPSISTIHVPKVSAGVKAANLLFSLMDRNKDDLIHEPVGFRMEGRLIIRNSTVSGMDEENWLVSEW
ncbi:LacI family DNA-binding transcriptional regulator [Treponema parvum]|uniref:LacI family DNA-binding transcriptional regulator n=1 Tax=Treponema parvum TaxID=138851 RepID=UPI001AEC14AD|nr:LacI family DNA-binding transcriptional regulator [Treponema parvum]